MKFNWKRVACFFLPLTGILSEPLGIVVKTDSLLNSVDGFNAPVIEACKEFEKDGNYKCHILYQNISGISEAVISSELSRIPNLAYVMMIGFTFGEVIVPLAEKNPKVIFSIIDSSVPLNAPQNARGIVFAEDEAAFLVGVIAGGFTTSKTVAVAAGMPVPPVVRFSTGFLRGVKYVCPTCNVLHKYLTDFGDAKMGIGAAKGADVIFGAGGFTGSSAIKYGASNGAWAIGVDSDEKLSTFANQSDPASRYLITSALKLTGNAARMTLQNWKNGKDKPGNTLFGVADGGCGVAEYSSELSYNTSKRIIQVVDSSSSSNKGKCASIITDSIAGFANRTTNNLRIGITSLGLRDGYLQSIQTSSNNTWSPLMSFGMVPPGLQGHSMTLIDKNRILVFGGNTADGQLSNRLFVYDLDKTLWQEITSAQTAPALRHHVAAYSPSRNALYVYGGMNSATAHQLNSKVWKFQIDNATWSQVTTTGGPVGGLTKSASALIQDRDWYVFGGQDDSLSISSAFYKLDLNTMEWKALTASGPNARYDAAMISANNTNILLFGGTNSESSNNELWRFSPANGWSLIPVTGTAPPKLARASMVQVDSRRVLISGGVQSSQMQSKSYIYNAGLEAWTDVNPELDMPYALQGHTLVALNQNATSTACVFPELPLPFLAVCTPLDRISVLSFGGVRADQGVSADLLVSFPVAEPAVKYDQFVPPSVQNLGYALGAIGIILSVMFLAAIGYYGGLKKEESFKSASPLFLVMYSIGAILAFIGIILYNAPGVQIQYCNAAVWLFSSGCNLIFSCMVMKNFRIYYIFSSALKKKTSNTNYAGKPILFLAVVVMTAVNLVVLGVFSRVSSFTIQKVVVDGENWPVCSCDQTTWLWILIAPLALILAFGLYLGFQTRNVWSRFNESAKINLSIYSTTLSMLILIPIALTIKSPTTQRIISTLVCCLSLYMVIGVNFFPKVYGIWFKVPETEAPVEGGEIRCRVCKQSIQRSSAKSSKIQTSSIAR